MMTRGLRRYRAVTEKYRWWWLKWFPDKNVVVVGVVECVGVVEDDEQRGFEDVDKTQKKLKFAILSVRRIMSSFATSKISQKSKNSAVARRIFFDIRSSQAAAEATPNTAPTTSEYTWPTILSNGSNIIGAVERIPSGETAARTNVRQQMATYAQLTVATRASS